MRALSQQYGCTLVFGLAERDADRVYNTAVVVSKGRYVGKYRKIHLSDFEKKLFDRGGEKPYGAAVSRESCARQERDELLTKVYGGATGDLIAAFLKESAISKQEVSRLRKLLDDMEV